MPSPHVVVHPRTADVLAAAALLTGLSALLLLPAMARHSALPPRFARFLARPLVGRALLMRGLAALTRDLFLLVPVHRCKSAVLFRQGCLLAYTKFVVRANTRAATDMPVFARN